MMCIQGTCYASYFIKIEIIKYTIITIVGVFIFSEDVYGTVSTFDQTCKHLFLLTRGVL